MEFIHRHLLLIVQNDFIETAVHLRDGSVELAQRVLLGIKQLLGTVILCQEKVQIKNDFFPSCQHT